MYILLAAVLFSSCEALLPIFLMGVLTPGAQLNPDTGYPFDDNFGDNLAANLAPVIRAVSAFDQSTLSSLFGPGRQTTGCSGAGCQTQPQTQSEAGQMAGSRPGDWLGTSYGRRRTAEEIHGICWGASDELKSKLKETLEILTSDGSNAPGLVTMAKKIRDEFCPTLDEENGSIRQCQGYAGLLMAMTSADDHPASLMLIAAYGSRTEQESACGIIVTTLNDALLAGHFTDLAVTQLEISLDNLPEDSDLGPEDLGLDELPGDVFLLDIVVAATEEKVTDVMGVGVSTELSFEVASAIGAAVSTTVYFLIGVCKDYGFAGELLAPL